MPKHVKKWLTVMLCSHVGLENAVCYLTAAYRNENVATVSALPAKMDGCRGELYVHSTAKVGKVEILAERCR